MNEKNYEEKFSINAQIKPDPTLVEIRRRTEQRLDLKRISDEIDFVFGHRQIAK